MGKLVEACVTAFQALKTTFNEERAAAEQWAQLGPMQPDEYREARVAFDKRLKEVMAAGDQPRVVADVVLRAASATRPKLRYTAGAAARRLRWLRRFAPPGLMDAGIRRDLRLDAVTASLSRPPVLAK